MDDLILDLKEAFDSFVEPAASAPVSDNAEAETA